MDDGEANAAYNVRKTHCPRDHEYTEANTYHYRGMRYCRACKKDRSRNAA